MERLTLLETVIIKKGCISAKIERYNTVKKRVKHNSVDSRAGKWTSDVYEKIAFITIDGGAREQYFCHTPNSINEAIELFYEGEYKRFLPKL